MKPRNLALTLLALAVFTGWWLATPPAGGGLTDDDLALLPDRETGLGGIPVQTALRTLYRRQAWSAVPPPEEAGTETEEDADGDAAPLPEGLDRFSLVGIIRVQGQPEEALLLDGAVRDPQPQSLARELRAGEGDTLRDSGVLLERIEGTRVKLMHAGETRWLELFRRESAENK